ncbi:pentapeptide repeat-containing protein [Halosimplex amylolyticum]|uniref:pentapeptide repeat-containing protein n=1 Tax=Halosimplex amylolyticum TaxID=3396616 RepID=UPI003F54F8D2
MSQRNDERCDYQLDVGLPDEELSTEPCGRPLWEDRDRCVWHTKEAGKTQDDLEESLPDPEENLNGAYLQQAELSGIDWFEDRELVGADFTEAHLNGADFSGANLMLATLTSVSGINADFQETNLEGAIFTNADLRRANLEGALLNEAVFTDVHIDSETTLGDSSVYERERVSPKLGDDHPLESASWAYRQLQQIYRDNGLPYLAKRSYNQEKDARRKLAWTKGDYPSAIKRELSRWIALYGSSPYRILLTSLVVIVGAAVVYPLTGGVREVFTDSAITYTLEDPGDAPVQWIGRVLFKSLYFSVITFTTLGYGDIQPVGAAARLVAGVESLLGALLAALLVFVLTRLVTW